MTERDYFSPVNDYSVNTQIPSSVTFLSHHWHLHFRFSHICTLPVDEFRFNLELPGNLSHCASSIFSLSTNNPSRWSSAQSGDPQTLSWDVKHGRPLMIQTGWHWEYLEGWAYCLHVQPIIFSKCHLPVLPPPVSHLTAVFETQAFQGKQPVLFSFSVTFLWVCNSQGRSSLSSVYCSKKFLIEVGFHVAEED